MTAANTGVSLPTKKQSRRAALIWGSVVVGLLLLQISLGVAGIMAAHSGGGPAIEQDYYDKAVNWDKQKAAKAAEAAALHRAAESVTNKAK